MASFSDQVKVLIDVDSTGATSGITKFKSSFAEAEGAVGKFKVASGAAFDFVKNNAATFAAAAGAAITAFAIDGIKKFQDLAISAGKFAEATGLNVEQASRWIEVAGDIGVGADTVQGAIDKLNKAIGANKPEWKNLGQEVVRTSDGLIDVNATFLKTVDAVNAIKDPTEKARVAASLFGKGWTAMSELIAQGSNRLTASLAEVSDQKVINEAELAKAREFRAAMDGFGDAVDDAGMKLGEALIPALTDAIKFITPAIEKLKLLADGFRLVVDAINPLDSAMSGVGRVTDSTSSIWEKGYGVLQTMGSVIPGVNVALDALGGWIFGSGDKADKSSKQTDRLKSSFEMATIAANRMRYQGLKVISDGINILDSDTNGLIDTFDNLLARLDQEESFRQLDENLRNYGEAVSDAFKKKTPEAIDAAKAAAETLIRQIAGVADASKIASQEQIKIVAAIEKGEFDVAVQLVKDAIKAIPKTVPIDIVGRVRGVPIPRGQTPSESRRSPFSLKGVSTFPEESGQAVNALDKDTNDLIDSWDSLLERLDRNEAWDNIGDQIAQYRRDLTDAFKKKTPDAARTAIESSRDVIRAFADIAQQAKLTNDQQIALKALMDKGDFDKAYAELEKMLKGLPTEVVISIKPGEQTGAAPTPTTPGAGVAPPFGGIVFPPGFNLITGPSAPSTPTFNPKNLLSSSPNVVVNVAGSVVSENDLVEQMRIGLINAQKSGKQLVYSNT